MYPLAARLSAALLVAGLALPASAQEEDAPAREGPFVTTDRTVTDLLADGFEIAGMLGSSMVLVKQAELYNCSLEPDREAMTYKPYFVCAKLDEIPRGEAEDAAETGDSGDADEAN